MKDSSTDVAEADSLPDICTAGSPSQQNSEPSPPPPVAVADEAPQPTDHISADPSGVVSEVQNDDIPHESMLAGFRRADRRFLRKLLAIVLTAFSVQWAMAWLIGPEPLELTRGSSYRQLFRVDINTATWVEWIQLEGIGPATAHQIEADLEKNGPFESIDDLLRVPGIGPATLNRIRPWLIHSKSVINTEIPRKVAAQAEANP